MRDLPGSLEQLFSDALERHGLSDKYDQIRPHGRLTFLMRVSPDKDDTADVPLGKSRLGGTPDLPTTECWAKSANDDLLLDFIAQINLSELPAAGQPLPKSGILHIYAQQEGACDNEHSIRLSPAANLVRSKVPTEEEFSDEDSDGPFRALIVTEFVPSVSLPDSLTAFAGFGDEFHESYSALERELHNLPTEKEPTSRLLGYPFDFDLPNDQELLIQVESHFHGGTCYMNFWDAGSLQILVQTAELPTCRFRASQANVFSH